MDDPLWTWPLAQVATEALPTRGSARDYLATWREATDRLLPPDAAGREAALQRLGRHLTAVTGLPAGEHEQVAPVDQLPTALYQDAVALYMTCTEALYDAIRGSGPVGKRPRRKQATSTSVTVRMNETAWGGGMYLPLGDDYDVDPLPFLGQLWHLRRLQAGLVALRRLCLRFGAAPEELKPVWPETAREGHWEILVYRSGQLTTSITWSTDQFRAAGFAGDLRDALRLPADLLWVHVQVEKPGSMEHEQVRLAGELPELGGWDPGHSLALEGHGDTWVGDVLIPRTRPDEQWPVKYVSRPPEYVWEPRGNRVIRTDAARSGSGITLLILDDVWGG